jgi:hypothetical protein
MFSTPTTLVIATALVITIIAMISVIVITITMVSVRHVIATTQAHHR